MKKAIIIDWLDSYGGAERVISSLFKVFSFDKCYTIIDVMDSGDKRKMIGDRDIEIEQSSLQIFGKKFRMAFLLFPRAMKSFELDKEVKIIISSSHAVAKGIKKSNDDQLHISYFQARNLKYIWDDSKLYLGIFRVLAYPLLKALRFQDKKDALLPDYIVSNSQFVKEWVKKTYNRDSTVIYPPVDLSNFKLTEIKEDYYVAVGRIELYKRFDIIIKAFNEIKTKRLIVIGEGSQLNYLKGISGSNIEFLGFLDSKEIFKYISKAKAFIHAGTEDFGIAPIEAQACGTPVIAYAKGGVLETILENETGMFFKEQNSKSLIDCIEIFENSCFDPHRIRKNSLRFSKERFEREIDDFVVKKYKEFKLRQVSSI